MKALEIKKAAIEIYNAKGLNGLYAFLRKNGIKFEKGVYEFGFAHKGAVAKKAFMDEKTNAHTMRFHYYAVIKTARNGYKAKLLRGIEITF